MTLSQDHRDYLLSHAITDETIERQLIRSEGNEIVFPWIDGDTRTEQRRPWPGESGVYFWEADKDLHFWTLRDAGAASPILLVEGTKQCLSATSHAPAGYTVMGMAGCWGWSKAKLGRFKGREVLLCLDADAGSNLDVYEAGEKLGEKLKRYGVNLRYLRIPGSGSQGLDDYLASIDADERADILAYEIENAQSKPAERRPTARKRKMESDLPDTGDRVPVAINLDRKMVIDKVTDALKVRHDGKDLFNYGEVLTRVKGHETQPLDRDRFYAMLADAVACFRYTEATDKRPAIFEPAWPDPPSIGAVMSKAEEFSPLKRVVRVPFLRPDGTICSEPGYDRETSTVLVRSGLGDLAVPLEPTHEQTRMAAKFLMEDWLGDLPFESDADRANALSMILTPFMRGTVPLVPLAVVNGLEAGVGKNLLADCAAILATGEAARPLPYVNQEEEMRKQITAAFASGAELFIFDEAHVVEGTQFARAVTSLTYTDRVLGVSRMANFPNSVTWMSLGNQVQVNGDMSRRVYFVCLSPAGTTLADRESYDYRHPDLKAWTTEHRTELVSAALTVLRGWVAAGRPAFSRGSSMGSFEPWDKFMSGVLAYAGLEGFLTDSRKRRSESDFVQAYWEAHVTWLYQEFGADPFTTRQVQEAALKDPRGYEAPPGMEDASGKSFTRQLGQGYSKHRNRTYNGLRLVKAGMGHKTTLKWQIDPGVEGEGGNGGKAISSTQWGECVSDTTYVTGSRVREEAGAIPPVPSVTSNEPVALAFDLETADAEELFTGRHEGPFVRLAGLGETDGTWQYTGPVTPEFLEELERADELVTADGFRYDLVAMAHHEGADYDALAAKNVDLTVRERLVDPPGAKGMMPWSRKGYYGLDDMAERYGLRGKTDDIKRLADKHGGFDRIPVDDPEYNAYLRGDLAATTAVKAVQDVRLEEMGLTAYAAREMRVAALQNRLTLNGWAVDEELLNERIAHEAQQRAEAIAVLGAEYGVPLKDPDVFRMRPKAEWPVEYRSMKVYDVRAAYTDEQLVSLGLGRIVVGETNKAPWATKDGRPALERAFHEVGAVHVPRTSNGHMAIGKDALGDKPWYDKNQAKAVPGVLQVYGDKPEVRRLVETVLQATGARVKYAEIAKYVVNGRAHGPIGKVQASGRWSQSPWTTMGKRGAAARERDVAVADEGHLLLAVDLSQCDVRTVAALSQDPELIARLQPGMDYHEEMAEIYCGDRSQRDGYKPVSHGVNYGMQARAIAEQYGLQIELVQAALNARGDLFHVQEEWTRRTRALAETGALLDNGFGRLMRCDPSRAFTQAPALMGQGATRDVMTESMLRLAKARPDVTPFMRAVVHDELVLSVPADTVDEWSQELKSAFTWEWRGVPILCDVSKPAYRWSDCKELLGKG